MNLLIDWHLSWPKSILSLLSWFRSMSLREKSIQSKNSSLIKKHFFQAVKNKTKLKLKNKLLKSKKIFLSSRMILTVLKDTFITQLINSTHSMLMILTTSRKEIFQEMLIYSFNQSIALKRSWTLLNLTFAFLKPKATDQPYFSLIFFILLVFI